MLNHICDLCTLCSQTNVLSEKVLFRRQIANWRYKLKLEAQKDFLLSCRDALARDDFETYSDLLEDLDTRCHFCQLFGGAGASICLLIRDYLDGKADLVPLEEETENNIVAESEKRIAEVIPIGWAEYTRRYQERR